VDLYEETSKFESSISIYNFEALKIIANDVVKVILKKYFDSGLLIYESLATFWGIFSIACL
jgi:hypothetical protein